MSQRQISNLTFRSALQADRVQVPVGFLGARGRIEIAVRFGKATLVKADGSFDRAGIMAAAASAAKDHQRTYGSTWATAMSVALKACWQYAAKLRRSAAH